MKPKLRTVWICRCTWAVAAGAIACEACLNPTDADTGTDTDADTSDTDGDTGTGDDTDTATEGV